MHGTMKMEIGQNDENRTGYVGLSLATLLSQKKFILETYIWIIRREYNKWKQQKNII